MKKWICLLLFFSILLSMTTAVSAESSTAQTDILLTPGADQSQMNFTWYAESAEAGTLLLTQLANVQNGQMPENAARFQSTVTKANDGDFYSHQLTVFGLESGTDYAYQLLNQDAASDIMSFTTAEEGAFSFAFVGDPQIGAGDELSEDISAWYNTLDIIGTNAVFADTAFLLSAGDHVNKASNESQYDGFLHHELLQSLPVASVIGNHDSGSDSFGQHFHLPNESAEYGVTDAGGDAYFVYNDVLFLLLNSNNTSTEEHRLFIEQALAANPNVTWKIAALHHSLYTVADHATDKKILTRREELVPLFQELGIDVVLMGHDHVYCRTYIMDGLTPITDSDLYDRRDYSSVTNPQGVLYVTANSSSGSKTYDIEDETFAYSAVQNQEHVPNVSKVSVSEDSFTITTYRTTDMHIVDSFTIHRTAELQHPFADVSEESWYANAVQYAYTNGLMNGMSATDFAPNDATTRGMFVTILHRMEGTPESGSAAFLDVPPERYYTDAISWAASNGIVNGYGSGRFGPEDTVTREQVAVILYRCAAANGIDTSKRAGLSSFPDASEVSAYARDAMQWAVAEGLLNGSSGKLLPQGEASRAQVATILMRYIRNIA